MLQGGDQRRDGARVPNPCQCTHRRISNAQTRIRILHGGNQGLDGPGIFGLSQRYGREILDFRSRVLQSSDQGLDYPGVIGIPQLRRSVRSFAKISVLQSHNQLAYPIILPKRPPRRPKRAEGQKQGSGEPLCHSMREMNFRQFQTSPLHSAALRSGPGFCRRAGSRARSYKRQCPVGRILSPRSKIAVILLRFPEGRERRRAAGWKSSTPTTFRFT